MPWTKDSHEFSDEKGSSSVVFSTIHTMTIIHAEHGPTMTLAGACQDMANAQEQKQTP